MWTDVNSLYPWAMTQKYPHECKEAKDILEYGLTEATIYVPMQPYAPLPYRTSERDGFSGISEGSIIFPCGKFTGTWTNHELRNAVENHGAKILKLHYTFGTDRATDPRTPSVEVTALHPPSRPSFTMFSGSK